ncbi:hypothetical protein [Helicobacter pylori]|uniref:hypothetical protein n=1 Tax=Helicobacter pylori TaxID=210 RepID=UPI000BBAF769|nr:hypothetical protein [Helicobacter pylori]
MASFSALGNLISKMRSGALRYKVPSVNLVHWYFNAPLKVVAKPWLRFLNNFSNASLGFRANSG